MNSTKLEIEIIVDCENPISSLVGALNPPMARFSFIGTDEEVQNWGIYEKCNMTGTLCGHIL